jgi:DNA-binding transcriptional LysR family regulator
VEIRQLRYFQMVAHTGRIGAAARQLGITQPALTAALRKLEADVGATLFVRDHRGAHLTASGRELAVVATETLRALEDAKQRIVDVEREPAGKVVIAAPAALALYALPAFVARFTAAHPRIALVLAAQPSKQVEANVIARDADLGLATHPLSHPDLVLVELFRDHVELVVRADDVAPSWAAASDRLAKGPIIFAPHVPQSREILDLLAARGLVPARRVEATDLGVVKELALAGVGIAILPRRVAAHRTLGALAALHDGLPGIPDMIRLCYRVDLHRRRAANLVKTALVDHGRTLA